MSGSDLRPAGCGDGLSIAPGDLSVGDQDGVLVVPKSETEAIVALAEQKFKLEQA